MSNEKFWGSNCFIFGKNTFIQQGLNRSTVIEKWFYNVTEYLYKKKLFLVMAVKMSALPSDL